MSRVAKNPVVLPAGVEIKLAGQQLSVKGAKGTLELNVHSSVEVIQEGSELRFAARNGDQQNRAQNGGGSEQGNVPAQGLNVVVALVCQFVGVRVGVVNADHHAASSVRWLSRALRAIASQMRSIWAM